MCGFCLREIISDYFAGTKCLYFICFTFMRLARVKHCELIQVLVLEVWVLSPAWAWRGAQLENTCLAFGRPRSTPQRGFREGRCLVVYSFPHSSGFRKNPDSLFSLWENLRNFKERPSGNSGIKLASALDSIHSVLCLLSGIYHEHKAGFIYNLLSVYCCLT